eukprot:m.60699 g.60699  ORF g.60699 m.60699 type:complete len:627 (+) comp11345_c0_seq1:2-1882(+)
MACGGVTALLLLLLPFSCAIIVENEIRNDVAAFKSEMCDDKKFFDDFVSKWVGAKAKLQLNTINKPTIISLKEFPKVLCDYVVKFGKITIHTVKINDKAESAGKGQVITLEVAWSAEEASQDEFANPRMAIRLSFEDDKVVLADVFSDFDAFSSKNNATKKNKSFWVVLVITLVLVMSKLKADKKSFYKKLLSPPKEKKKTTIQKGADVSVLPSRNQLADLKKFSKAPDEIKKLISDEKEEAPLPGYKKATTHSVPGTPVEITKMSLDSTNMQSESPPPYMKSEKKVYDTVMPPPIYKRSPGETQYVLQELTNEQTKILEEFKRDLADISKEDWDFCDDGCLLRYLRARDYKRPPAEKLLRDTLKWRRMYGIENIELDEALRLEQESGKVYVHGVDKLGRPVMYQRPRRQNTKNYVAQVKQVAYLLERETMCMDLSKGVEKHVVIIDMKGYSTSNRPPMSVSKEVLSLLQDKFPERLGAAIVVDPSTLFWMFWHVIKVFLPAETKQKVHFIFRKEGEMHPVFQKYFEPEQLEEEYGGKLTGKWDGAAYWTALTTEKEELQAWYHARAQSKPEEQKRRTTTAIARDAIPHGHAVPAVSPTASIHSMQSVQSQSRRRIVRRDSQVSDF